MNVIITPHRNAGIFSLFNNVITCMDQYEKVEVQWNPQRTPYKASTVVNLWHVVAETLDVLTADEANEADRIDTYPHQTYTGRKAGWSYLSPDGWRERLHGHFKRITLNPAIDALIRSQVCAATLQTSIGVLYRGAEIHAREQLSGKRVPIETVIAAVNGISRTAPVFVACDSEQSLELFIEAFGASRVSFFRCLDRSPVHGLDPHKEVVYGEDHVQGVFAQTVALSRCMHLVHQVSNMATAALYMSPRMSHTFVQSNMV